MQPPRPPANYDGRIPNEKTLRPVAHRLSPKDLKILRAIRDGKGQWDVARMFGATQASISYRMDRIILKLDYWLRHRFTSAEAHKALTAAGIDPKLRETFVVLWDSGVGQSETAMVLGISQGLVRHRLTRLHAALKDLPTLAQYFAALDECISKKKWNLGRTVRTTQATIGA